MTLLRSLLYSELCEQAGEASSGSACLCSEGERVWSDWWAKESDDQARRNTKR
jgi:hypothetical protein